MERCGKMVGSLLVVLTLTAGTQAIHSFGATSDDPYRAIVDRNVFDLRPMPTKNVDTAPPAPPPNVKLVGLLMVTGQPQAVISILDQSAPNKQPETYILAEEQRHASVEVKSINMDGKSARVDIGGNVVQLKLEEMKVPAGPAPGPATAGGPGQGRFVPGARAGGRGAFPVPAPAANPAAPSYQPNSDNSALPTRPVRTDTGDAAQPALTPEQSLIQMEQNRDMYQQNNDPRAALLPPNPLQAALQNQAAADNATGGQQEQPTTQQPQLPAYLNPRGRGTLAPPPLPP
jgi:hypothetical protein